MSWLNPNEFHRENSKKSLLQQPDFCPERFSEYFGNLSVLQYNKESWLCHFLAEWPQANTLTSPSLSFVICEMGVIVHSASSQGWNEHFPEVACVVFGVVPGTSEHCAAVSSDSALGTEEIWGEAVSLLPHWTYLRV